MNKIIVTLTYIPISTHDKKKSQKYFLQSTDTLFLKYKCIYFNNLIMMKLNNVQYFLIIIPNNASI